MELSLEEEFSTEKSTDYIAYLKQNIKKIIGEPELKFSIIEQANYSVENGVVNLTTLAVPAYKRISSV